MCVIILNDRSNDDLTYNDLRMAWDTNPHGCGWMAQGKDKVIYKKGLSLYELYHDYLSLRDNPNIGAIALHFRIATSGGINAHMCHPFPLTNNVERLKATEGETDVCVMHNGVLFNGTEDLSDTALYIRDNLSRRYNRDKRFYDNFNRRSEFEFENEIHGNRILFMDAEGYKGFGSGWSEWENKGWISNRYFINNFYYWKESKH